MFRTTHEPYSDDDGGSGEPKPLDHDAIVTSILLAQHEFSLAALEETKSGLWATDLPTTSLQDAGLSPQDRLGRTEADIQFYEEVTQMYRLRTGQVFREPPPRIFSIHTVPKHEGDTPSPEYKMMSTRLDQQTALLLIFELDDNEMPVKSKAVLWMALNPNELSKALAFPKDTGRQAA